MLDTVKEFWDNKENKWAILTLSLTSMLREPWKSAVYSMCGCQYLASIKGDGFNINIILYSDGAREGIKRAEDILGIENSTRISEDIIEKLESILTEREEEEIQTEIKVEE